MAVLLDTQCFLTLELESRFIAAVLRRMSYKI